MDSCTGHGHGPDFKSQLSHLLALLSQTLLCASHCAMYIMLFHLSKLHAFRDMGRSLKAIVYFKKALVGTVGITCYSKCLKRGKYKIL